MTERLTTLARVKSWLNITNNSSDNSLLEIIDSASRFTLGYLGLNSLSLQDRDFTFIGNGKSSMLLKYWPIQSITSVQIGNLLLNPSIRLDGNMPTVGYYLGDNRLGCRSIELYGYCFIKGMYCRITYKSGYQKTMNVISTTSAGAVSIVTKDWVKGVSVTIEDVLAEEVSANPTSGQYRVIDGVYHFNPSDTNKLISISYIYCPEDLSFGVTEMIGEWFKKRDRIGILSKNLGGQESITFDNSLVSKSVKANIQLYKNEAPL